MDLDYSESNNVTSMRWSTPVHLGSLLKHDFQSSLCLILRQESRNAAEDVTESRTVVNITLLSER
jgi:hypothetical protein